MADRNTRQVAVSADTLRMLLQSAAQAMPAGAGAEFEQHLTAAVQEGMEALNTTASTHGESLLDHELIPIIERTLDGAYPYVDDADNRDLCNNIEALEVILAGLRRGRAAGRRGADIEPMSMLEAVRSGDSEGVRALLNAARQGRVIRLT